MSFLFNKNTKPQLRLEILLVTKIFELCELNFFSSFLDVTEFIKPENYRLVTFANSGWTCSNQEDVIKKYTKINFVNKVFCKYCTIEK